MATGYSTKCSAHKRAHVRHGHPLQAAISVHQLRPYVARVVARQQRNSASEVWPALDQRWAGLVEGAGQMLARYGNGEPSYMPDVKAAHHVRSLSGAVVPAVVVQTILAMYLLQDDQPRLFRDDRAFDFQMVRRVRLLAPSAAGSYFDHRTGRSKKVYKDVPSRVTEILAASFKAVIGGTGVHLAGLERRDAEEKVKARDQFRQALGALQ